VNPELIVLSWKSLLWKERESDCEGDPPENQSEKNMVKKENINMGKIDNKPF